MLVKTAPDVDTRLLLWSKRKRQAPEELIQEVLNEALDDWEDYEDALRISSEVDSGRMKTYTLEEVERQLDELNAMEG